MDLKISILMLKFILANYKALKKMIIIGNKIPLEKDKS